MAPPHRCGLLLLLYLPCNLYPLHFLVSRRLIQRARQLCFFSDLAINKGSTIAEFTVVGRTAARPEFETTCRCRNSSFFQSINQELKTSQYNFDVLGWSAEHRLQTCKTKNVYAQGCCT